MIIFYMTKWLLFTRQRSTHKHHGTQLMTDSWLVHMTQIKWPWMTDALARKQALAKRIFYLFMQLFLIFNKKRPLRTSTLPALLANGPKSGTKQDTVINERGQTKPPQSSASCSGCGSTTLHRGFSSAQFRIGTH